MAGVNYYVAASCFKWVKQPDCEINSFMWACNLANVFGDKVTGPAAKLKATKGEGG